VKVEMIYEPPQETSDVSFDLFDDPKADLVEGLVAMLGLQKVGWIFAHPSREKGFYFSGPELMFTAEQQLEAAQGINDTPFVTVTVSKDENNQVVVEAFQVSKQCMEMVAEGVLGVSENLGSCVVNPTFTVEVEGRASKEVDNAFFLVSVPIKQFDTEFLVSKFPRANRIDSYQTRDDLQTQLLLVGKEGWTMVQLLSDFQLLLFLTDYLDPKDDIPKICKSICDREIPLDEGYCLLLRSIAGIE
jgi:nuclear protein localization family protein 4